MKKKPTNHYKEAIDTLLEIKSQFPDYSLGMHLSTILDDYGDIWGISDKELSFAITKYRAKLQMDVPRETSDKELDKILKDGMNLTLDMEE